MNVAILSARRGYHTDELQRALSARSHTSAVVPITALAARVGARPGLAGGGTSLDQYDAAIVRIIPRGSLEQIIFRMDALHVLELRGMRVINRPGAIERTVDKYYTTALLAAAGLPTPRTVVAERWEDALAAFRELGDVLVKPLFGSMGRGIVRVDDEELAYRVFRALELERAVYYLQRTVPHAGRDIRAFVVGGRVVAAMERQAEGWRTNIARGGRAVPIQLSAALEELSLRAAAAVGCDYAGVDLLPAADGEVYVLEVNGIPGWEGLQTTTEVDIAGAIVATLEDRG
jgi:RimK family alpha-L-glutamate ligase